jgi:DNA-binding response OmpR family regulator
MATTEQRNAPPAPSTITGTALEASEAPPTKGRVLIVEDEPGLAEILSLHFEGAGYSTTVCHSGLTALYELDRMEPCVVLLDLHLPEVSGFRLMHLLKQRASAPNMPVVVITALSFPEAEEAVRAGADDFITKPFLPEEVVTRVERLLDRVR